jgi:hypothetical protein
MSTTFEILLFALFCTMLVSIGMVSVALIGGFAGSAVFGLCGMVSLILHMAYFGYIMETR